MKNLSKYILYLTSGWLVFLFLFNPHYVELTGVLETWFPTKGLIYYKDFSAYHFPLGRLILLPIHLLSGWNLEVDPFFGLAVGIGTLILIYSFGKKSLSSTTTSVALVFFSLFFWYAATGILFFHEMLIGLLLAGILLIIYQIHKSKKNLKKTKIFFLGVLMSLTLLSGQVAMVTLGIVGLLIVFVIFEKTKDLKKTFSAIASLIISFCFPLVLFSGYFLLKNAFREFFYYNLTYYFEYASYDKDLTSLPAKELVAFYSPLAILLINCGIAFIKNKKIRFELVAILLLSLSTIPFVVFSVYHPHHLNYALPILALAAGFAFDSSKDFYQKVILAIGAVTFLYIAAVLIIPWHLDRLVFPPSMKIANDLYPNSADPMNQAVQWIKENTPPAARIMVMGDPLFYLRSNRLPAARPCKGIPYGWNPFWQIKKEIQIKRPTYWLIDRQFMKKLINNHKRYDIVDFINQELESCYQKQVSFNYWEVWQKTCH